MGEFIKTVNEVAHHRNGVTGEPFHAVRFVSAETGDEMLGIVFPGKGQIAVLNLGTLLGSQERPGTVAFGINSFRGDRFESELRRAVREKP